MDMDASDDYTNVTDTENMDVSALERNVKFDKINERFKIIIELPSCLRLTYKPECDKISF